MARRAIAKDQIVKLIVGAGQASPSPPVGPALGSKGVKSMDFCKEFNAMTAHMQPGTPIPSVITVRPDRSFTFTLRTPPTATLLFAAAGVQPGKGGKIRGANAPGRTPEGAVNVSDPKLRTPALAQSPQASPGGGSLPGGKTLAPSSGGASEVGEGIKHLVSRQAGGDKQPGHGGGTAQVGEVSLKHVYEIAKIKQTEERLKGLSLEGLVRSVIAQARSVGIGVVP